jgi:hypothetical protein
MSEKIAKADWQRRSRRAFLTAGAGAIAGGLGLTWLFARDQIGALPWPLRTAHQANERVWRALYGNDRLGDSPAAPPVGTVSRQNGDLGLQDEAEIPDWKISITTPAATGDATASLKLDALQRMPQTEATALFKCIEGWSEPIAYRGVRFSDFLAATGVGTRDAKPWMPSHGAANLFSYVGLETPNGQYYVSLDMESMLHPKTVLATEINGRPIDEDHGAPLRLIVPVKYGIKNLKRIARITFADTRPHDYWAEEGYDWYAGL